MSGHLASSSSPGIPVTAQSLSPHLAGTGTRSRAALQRDARQCGTDRATTRRLCADAVSRLFLRRNGHERRAGLALKCLRRTTWPKGAQDASARNASTEIDGRCLVALGLAFSQLALQGHHGWFIVGDSPHVGAAGTADHVPG